ncbi:MAG: hypothetical protein A3H92_08575 [Rhodospirillales bacterium RIFCSPLOWO2_02_FULL_58_16]|nr:MAG: hypothetical protein A3H92_08575 [Rhodospirillales bacterium RIFCSPLOWO2_02_FULL_58_16]
MVFRILALALFLVVLSVSAGEAGDAASVFPASAGEQETLTFDPATSSSRCIGNPVTPLCAVETYEACYLWVDKKVCAAMGIDPATFTFTTGAYFKLGIYHYRIETQKVIDAEDVALVAKDLDKSKVSPGDVVIQLRWESCAPVDACVFESLRRKGCEPVALCAIMPMDDNDRAFGEGCPPTQCGTEKDPQTYLVRDIGGKWQVVGWYADKTFHGEFWE